ncbi:MAG: aryl-sulfate sulfotransferase [Candidatus Omnitrophota bacterium]
MNNKLTYILTISIFFFHLCFVYTVSAEQGKKPQGNSDRWTVDIWKKEKACNGTTLFTDTTDMHNPRIVEVDMEGRVVWEYRLPDNLKPYYRGIDVERLSNGNTLFVCALRGVYEVNKEGDIIWSYKTSKISHDADRLPNGNTLYVFGMEDKITDAQVTEVDKYGHVVWKWSVSKHLDKFTYNPDHLVGGFTHTCAVQRLSNGNTLICLRNFNCLAEVTKQGDVIRIIGKGIIYYPHDPEILDSGDILVISQYPLLKNYASQPTPDESVFFYPVAQINSKTGEITWSFDPPNWKQENLTCDADRLPNGNTLILTPLQIIEVTPKEEIVWRLKVNAKKLGLNEVINGASRLHYLQKIQRITRN